VTLREWDALHGQESRGWNARLRKTQRQHERGEIAYRVHMALVDQKCAWLDATGFQEAWEASKP
jgi:hypothetical protein